MIRTIAISLLAAGALAIFTIRAAYPAINGLEVVTIRTPSMQPVLPPGALVYVKPQPAYHVGDIVSFHTESGIVVTHRLVAEWTGDGTTGPFATQGDANNARDADILSKPAIIGRAESYIPWVGFITPILGLPPVIAFVLILSLTILLWPALTGGTHASPDSAARRSHAHQ